ncbi:MAG: AbrB/MazE/SpoVT family DNA-binding domain-containing protein [Anaerolineae bacterium]
MKAGHFASEAVTVSSKYQIVIPRGVRKYLDLKPGQKLRVVLYDGQVRLVPVRPMSEMQGRFAGIDTSFEREEDEWRGPGPDTAAAEQR